MVKKSRQSVKMKFQLSLSLIIIFCWITLAYTSEDCEGIYDSKRSVIIIELLTFFNVLECNITSYMYENNAKKLIKIEQTVC